MLCETNGGFKNLISDDEFIGSQIDRRKVILSNAYPIRKLYKENKELFFFSTIGPPHPYWIDIYQVIINYYSKGELIKSTKMNPPRDLNIPLFDRAFSIDTFEIHSVDSIVVLSKYGTDIVELYSIDTDACILALDDEAENSVLFKTMVLRDAKLNGDTVCLHSLSDGC